MTLEDQIVSASKSRFTPDELHFIVFTSAQIPSWKLMVMPKQRVTTIHRDS